MAKVKIEGMADFARALRATQKKYGKAFEKGSDWAAQRFLEENNRLVPKETGALRASAGHYQEGKGWETETVIGYGFEVSGFFREPGHEEKEPREYAAIQEIAYERKRTAGTIIYYLQTGLAMHESLFIDIYFDYFRFVAK